MAFNCTVSQHKRHPIPNPQEKPKIFTVELYWVLFALFCYYRSYCLDTFTRRAFLNSILQLHHISFALNAKSPSPLISFNPNLKIMSTFKAPKSEFSCSPPGPGVSQPVKFHVWNLYFHALPADDVADSARWLICGTGRARSADQVPSLSSPFLPLGFALSERWVGCELVMTLSPRSASLKLSILLHPSAVFRQLRSACDLLAPEATSYFCRS